MQDRDEARDRWAPAHATSVVTRRSPTLAEAVEQAGDLALRFDIERVIATGGMGLVVRALDRASGQPVAIKLLRDPGALEPRRVARMLREARVTSALRSPHVVRVWEAGTLSSGAPYSIMEYLEGIDFAALLRKGTLGVAEIVDAIVQACDAVAEAHAAGVVHRDLKPSNLFRVASPPDELHVKVLDFGIARYIRAEQIRTSTLTDGEALVGTPAYMPPEQVRGLREIDGRADVWALGVVLYEALSGATPFPGVNVADTLVRIASEPHVPLLHVAPHVPPGVAATVGACLEKDRERRPRTAAELARLLAPYATARSAAALRSMDAREPPQDAPDTLRGAERRAAHGARRSSGGGTRARAWVFAATAATSALVWALTRTGGATASPPAAARAVAVAPAAAPEDLHAAVSVAAAAASSATTPRIAPPLPARPEAPRSSTPRSVPAGSPSAAPSAERRARPTTQGDPLRLDIRP